MKYIKTQNGMIFSVSQLLPPSRGMKGDPEDTSEWKEIWRLSLITMDGQRHTYATYDQDDAFEVYEFVVAFMRSSYLLLEFDLGDDDMVWPLIYENRNEELGSHPENLEEEKAVEEPTACDPVEKEAPDVAD